DIAPIVSNRWVISAVFAPIRAAAEAASQPAWPPPMTMTSYRMTASVKSAPGEAAVAIYTRVEVAAHPIRVMAGQLPAISMIDARRPLDRDRRDRPGDDARTATTCSLTCFT